MKTFYHKFIGMKKKMPFFLTGSSSFVDKVWWI